MRTPLLLLLGLVYATLGLTAGVVDAQSSPFAQIDLKQLLLQTPDVSRDTNLSTGNRLYLNVVGKSGGYVLFDQVSSGQTIDGDWLLAVPLDSGGSGGVFTGLVFRSKGGAPDYVGSVDSKAGKLLLTVHDGHLFANAPLYAKGDPDCCPSYRVVKRLLYSERKGGLYVVTTEKLDLTRPPASPTPH